MDKQIMSMVTPQTIRRYKAAHTRLVSSSFASIRWDSPARFLLR